MKSELEARIAALVQELYDVAVVVELTRPEEQFGDYATNVAMQIVKQVGKNPREIGETLAGRLREEATLQSVEVAGPGFLNLMLSDAALVESLSVAAEEINAGKVIIVEYSDPNPFKPLHAGHLYTTLVGDAISRLVERSGAKTVRINFGGDVGLHAGKSMWAIVQWLGGERPEKLGEIPEAERPNWLGARYVEGNNAYEDDEAAKAEIVAYNKRVYGLHDNDDHDSPFARIYWTCREWSYRYFETLYEQLQVIPFDRYLPESEVTPLGLTTVREGIKRGIYVESDGAVVYHGDEEKGLHTRVFINREGIPTYETKDVGLSLTKWRDYHYDESIIITANEQAQYMQVVIASIREIEPEAANRTTHLTHGVVKLQGGVKMSSRKGNILSALDVLEAARTAAKAAQPDSSEETVLAAVKYAFLRNRIGGDIIYDPNESVALEGNSGPYLQYAHARARSILSKASSSPDEGLAPLKLQGESLQPAERTLIRKLTEYPEVIMKATAELMPHHICTYLYELAQAFNRFYEDNRVIGDEREAFRLALVETYANTLRDGLTLLGIHAPNRM
jgi:arginyl-tRNA synthetase